jgi:hypothetical protein
LPIVPVPRVRLIGLCWCLRRWLTQYEVDPGYQMRRQAVSGDVVRRIEFARGMQLTYLKDFITGDYLAGKSGIEMSLSLV